jgi:hypothetical protein
MSRSAESYIRGLLADVITGSGNEVQQRHFVSLAASATARGDGLAAFDAVNFNSAVVPPIDVDPTEIRH